MCVLMEFLTQKPLTRAPSLFGHIWSQCRTRLYWHGAGRFEWVLHLDLFVRHHFGGWVLPLARSVSILVLWWLAEGSFGRLDPDGPSNATPHPWPLVSWEVHIRHWGGEGICWGSWQTQLVSALQPHPLAWSFPTSPGFCGGQVWVLCLWECGQCKELRCARVSSSLCWVSYCVPDTVSQGFSGFSWCTSVQNVVMYQQHSIYHLVLASLEFLWSGGEAKG